jgi:capsular polysaccharide biosynthesis protein
MGKLRHLRTRIAAVVGRFSPGSKVFGPPKSTLSLVRSAGSVQMLPATSWPGGGTDTTGEAPRAARATTRGKNTDGWAPFVAAIPQGRVYCDGGVAVLTRDDEVCEELTRAGIGGPAAEHRIFRAIKLPRLHKLARRAACLAVPAGNVYYHWLLDSLPRLAVLEAACIPLNELEQVVVNGTSRPFQREILAHLGLLPRCVSLEDHPHIQSDELIVPSFVHQSGSPAAWVPGYLRKLLAPLTSGIPPSANERLYISRGLAARRRVKNESEILPRLKAAGFRILQLESMSVAEQIAAFSTASVVMGLSGSGFANLVFAPSHGRAIVWFPAGKSALWYRNLAVSLGWEYEEMRFPTTPAAPPPLGKPIGDRDIVVSPKEIERVLATL